MKRIGWLPTIWLLTFVFVPILIVISYSFQSRGAYGAIDWDWRMGEWSRALDPIYIKILWKSFLLALFTSFVCLVISYPVAWALATLPSQKRTFALLLLAIPLFTNLLTRVYAIKVFVSFDGPLLALLEYLNVEVDPFAIGKNQILVSYGMITTYLPFSLFPIYVALEKFDFRLAEAARDLGARSWHLFFKIIVPSTKNAAKTSFLLVFVPALGEFVIPDLLGGAKTMLLGNLITEQFLKSRNWPFGAVLTTLFLGLLGFSYFVSRLKNARAQK